MGAGRTRPWRVGQANESSGFIGESVGADHSNKGGADYCRQEDIEVGQTEFVGRREHEFDAGSDIRSSSRSDRTVGTLSTDGRYVFAVDDVGVIGSQLAAMRRTGTW